MSEASHPRHIEAAFRSATTSYSTRAVMAVDPRGQSNDGTRSAPAHTVNLNSFEAPERLYLDEQDVEPTKGDRCWSHIVILESNPLRVMWSIVIFAMLAYTASIYLYRFSFCFFHIGPDGPTPIGENDLGWNVIDTIVDVAFWIDLVLNFFFSYRDARGCEIASMKLIIIRYLKGYFWVNLVACMPEVIGEVVMWIFAQGSQGDGRNFDFRVARLTRLQRMSRLTRLMRLTRLVKCFSTKSTSPFMKWFQSLRGVRIVNFFFGLVWSVHLLACGWYLCAALHTDVRETWVARRPINTAGEALLLAPPAEQWVHAMYFVLTVFTTVGFGDISAGTEAEILYVAFTMMVGAVVHSIIISEVIQVVTSTDRMSEFVEKQLALVEAFSEHTELPWDSQNAIKDEIKYRARSWMTSYNYNKDEMKELITGKHIPRWLLGSLPAKMFAGKILENALFSGRGNLYVPPRLPCLLAVSLHQSEFEAGEIVYQMHDFPFNLFLVLQGTFAHIGQPGPNGAVDMTCEGQDNGDQMAERRLKKQAAKRESSQKQGGFMNKLVAYEKSVTSPTAHQHHREHMSKQGGLFPYRLSGHNSYFGDVEMLMSRARLSTVRCESQSAMVLLLHKTDFADLKDQFPQFGALWSYAGRRREWSRQTQLKRCTRSLTCRNFAAVQIQEFWRPWRAARPRTANDMSAADAASCGHVRAARTSSSSCAGDIQGLARSSQINDMGGRLMNHISHSESCRDSAVLGEPDAFGSDRHAALEKHVAKLGQEVGALREDMRAVLRALGVRPGGGPGGQAVGDVGRDPVSTI